MRNLLRLVAAYTAASVLTTVVFILNMWHRGGLPYLLHSGAFGVLTIAGWAVTLVVGPPAFVLLWKRENGGRILSVIVWASVCLYYVSGALVWHGRPSFPMVGSAILTILLLLPAARRACVPANP